MSDHVTLSLTDGRRALEDRTRAAVDDLSPGALPDVQYRTTLYDMALTHLYESMQAHEEWDGDPETAKAFATSVIRPHYRTSIEVKRP